MLKLMKYEWIREKKLLLLGFATLGLLEVLMIFCLYQQGNYLNLFYFIMVFLFPVAFVFILIDGIQMISKDLNRKEGYMLFLTPSSGYQIVVSKLLVNFINLVLSQVIILTIYAVNYELARGIFLSGLPPIYDVLVEILDSIISVIIPYPWVALLGVLYILFIWFEFSTTVYLSIILTKTILSQVKFKGLFSFIFFILLNIGIRIIQTLFMGLFQFQEQVNYELSRFQTMDQIAYSDGLLKLGLSQILLAAVIVIGFGYLSGRLIHKHIDL